MNKIGINNRFVYCFVFISILVWFINRNLFVLSLKDYLLLVVIFLFFHNTFSSKKRLNNVVVIDELEKENFKLREKIIIQSAQLSSILNNMPFIVYLKDTQGRFVVGNKKLEFLLNRKNSEFVGQKSADICLKAFAKDVCTEDKRVLKDKETVVVELKNDLLNKDGDWYRVIKSPILTPNNKPIGMIVIVENINKEKELEQQRETLVATLTHDLKTPTNAQLTAMNLLLNESLGLLNDEQKDLIKQVKNSNVYMSNMISTILDAYKSEESDIKLLFEKFDFCEAINSTCKELAGLAETRNQKIILRFDVKDRFIFADKLQLKRAVTNLIANAIVHGYEKTDVFVEVKEKYKNIVFNVKNKSRYIEKDKLLEIFEKYKSIKCIKSNKAGTGLGLYLTKKIIKLHNGEIYAKSWEDNTCLFGFSIPKNPIVSVKHKI